MFFVSPCYRQTALKKINVILEYTLSWCQEGNETRQNRVICLIDWHYILQFIIPFEEIGLNAYLKKKR